MGHAQRHRRVVRPIGKTSMARLATLGAVLASVAALAACSRSGGCGRGRRTCCGSPTPGIRHRWFLSSRSTKTLSPSIRCSARRSWVSRRITERSRSSSRASRREPTATSRRTARDHVSPAPRRTIRRRRAADFRGRRVYLSSHLRSAKSRDVRRAVSPNRLVCEPPTLTPS